MLDYGFYNMDCMEGMKEFPDKYFDLAIVDPPYGAGFTEGGGCKDWFTKYHHTGGGTTTDLGIPEAYLKDTNEKGRTQRKKLFRGILPQGKNILQSFFVSHEIRLYGAAITLNFPRHGVF